MVWNIPHHYVQGRTTLFSATKCYVARKNDKSIWVRFFSKMFILLIKTKIIIWTFYLVGAKIMVVWGASSKDIWILEIAY